MLALLLLLALPLRWQIPDALADSARAVAAVPRAALRPSGTDSARVIDAARRAQATFELVRRRNLPHEFGLFNHPCDVIIGRWCHWHENDEERKPPPESPRIIEARERLLSSLDSLGTLLPADEWIAGQRVRYLVEIGRYSEAVTVAQRCAQIATVPSTRAWCAALEGFAHHEQGAFAAADSDFTRSLADLPEADRCRFTDISRLLDGAPAKRYDSLPCATRDTFAARVWRIAQPLYLLGANDWRTEFFARMTNAHLEKNARRPFSMSWSDDDLETVLRYGPGRWYTREEAPPGSMRDAMIASHPRGPGFSFFPAERAIMKPESLRTDDWDYRFRASRTRYAPTYLKSLRTLAHHQLAMFRRGDSALVVAAFDVGSDTSFGREHVDAGLFLLPLDRDSLPAPVGAVKREAQGLTVLTSAALWRPMLASLEVLDTARRTAARARYGLAPSDSQSRVTLSDVLLYAPRDSTPAELTDALPLALSTEVVSADRPLGLFWETYGVRPTGEVFGVALTVERIGVSWLRRAAETIRLTTRGAPLSVQWQEVPNRGTGIASRGVAVDLSRLQPGRYRIRVSVTPRGEPPVVSTREIEVVRPS